MAYVDSIVKALRHNNQKWIDSVAHQLIRIGNIGFTWGSCVYSPRLAVWFSISIPVKLHTMSLFGTDLFTRLFRQRQLHVSHTHSWSFHRDIQYCSLHLVNGKLYEADNYWNKFWFGIDEIIKSKVEWMEGWRSISVILLWFHPYSTAACDN